MHSSSSETSTLRWGPTRGSHFLELFDGTHQPFALAFAHYLFFFFCWFGSLFILFGHKLGIIFGFGALVPCSIKTLRSTIRFLSLSPTLTYEGELTLPADDVCYNTKYVYGLPSSVCSDSPGHDAFFVQTVDEVMQNEKACERNFAIKATVFSHIDIKGG